MQVIEFFLKLFLLLIVMFAKCRYVGAAIVVSLSWRQLTKLTRGVACGRHEPGEVWVGVQLQLSTKFD